MAIQTLEDLIAQNVTVPVSEYGLDNILVFVQNRLEALNNAVTEGLSLFTEQSTDARRIWGSSEDFRMVEVDELGKPRTQKPGQGVEVHFPLRRFAVSVGNSKDWMYRKTAAEYAKRVLAMETSYKKRVYDELAFGIFNKASYTVKDMIDDTSLSVKAFLNADSLAIPNNSNGDSFTPATHQHYKGTAGAALAVADVDGLITNVTEHDNKGVVLFISASMKSVLAGLSGSKFVAATYNNIVVASGSLKTQVDPNDDKNNMFVGTWDGLNVFTRSWVPSGYIVAVATGADDKPLVYRVDPIPALAGFHIAGKLDSHPLMAEVWEANFGFGAYNRSAVAVLDTAHQTTYSNPTLIRTV